METTRTNPLWRGTAVALLFSVLLLPTPAMAGAQTLKRGVGNIIQAPIDLALTPITAGIVVYRNMRNIDDTTAVRVAYALPGYLWLVGLFMGASVLRCFSGFLEFIPGLFLVFTDAEMDPMFAPVERGEAVIWDYPTAVMDFKIGMDYTAAPF